MNQQDILNSFQQLNLYINKKDDELVQCIELAARQNSWFTTENIDFALDAISAGYLHSADLNSWAASYKFQENSKKKVGIIMAGNIPFVGFHDLLCVLVSGHSAKIKLSSKDNVLPLFLIRKLASINHGLAERMEVVTGTLKPFDAIIATGNKATAAQFKTYFSAYPYIIRGHRNGLAVLTGNETKEQLQDLGTEVFMHYGLGCRNVSKLFIPKGYDLQQLLDQWSSYDNVLDNHKYKHNFDYNLTLLLMNNIDHKKNNSIMLTENEGLDSRIATLHYQYYDSMDKVNAWIKVHEAEIQCVFGKGFLPFGSGQKPSLTDYADDVDTMGFLEGISS